MIVENTDQAKLKSLYDSDTRLIISNLIAYSNSTKIKVYDSKTGEPLGDVPENEISNYIAKTTEVLYVNEKFNDETGLFYYVLETML